MPTSVWRAFPMSSFRPARSFAGLAAGALAALAVTTPVRAEVLTYTSAAFQHYVTTSSPDLQPVNPEYGSSVVLTLDLTGVATDFTGEVHANPGTTPKLAFSLTAV